MDPFLEQNPIFQELHTQMLAEAQAQLQPQLRPKYIARLERHLSEGGVWDLEVGVSSLEGKEPDITIARGSTTQSSQASTAVLATPTASATEELTPGELELRKQRRIVIYVQSRPRIAVTTIELLIPSNKDPGSNTQTRYLEKRSSALHGGLHWVEIDLLRGGQRPPMPVSLPGPTDYLAYVAQARSTGWNHLVYTWCLRDPIPGLPIPLLGPDQVTLDLATCFRAAYDRIAADDECDYRTDPPAPLLKPEDQVWLDELLRRRGLRP
jgi:Protein of unknown function (DUF4058)